MASLYDNEHQALSPVFFFAPDRFEGRAADLLVETITAFCGGRKAELAGFFASVVEAPERAWVLDEPASAYIAASCCGDPIRARALATLRDRGATEAACVNDLGAFLIRAGDYPLAEKLLRLVLPNAAGAEFAIWTNLAVAACLMGRDRLADQDKDGAARALTACASIAASPDRPPYGMETLFEHVCRYIHAALRPEGDAGRLPGLVTVMTTLISSQPARNRDMALESLFTECLPVSRALYGTARDLVEVNAAARILRAVLAFCLEGKADLDEVAALDRDVSGFLCLTLQASAAEADGDNATEVQCLRALVDRYPDRSFGVARLAGALFRSGDLDTANRMVADLVPRESDYFSMMKDVADRNQAQLEEGIENGALERSQEDDNYQDPDWAKKAWDGYDVSFRSFTRHQDIGVAINAFWVDALAALLEADDTIASCLNFGSFNGYFDKVLAERFPDRRFVGFDRYEDGIIRSREKYVAPNLSFKADASVDDLLRSLRADGPVALSHIRTCTTLYPAGVADLYRRCAEAGVDYIVGVEGAGYSFAVEAFIPQDDPVRPPVVPLGIMVDHNYPALLSAAGFEVVSRSVRPYPIPFEFRFCGGLKNVVVFVARRIEGGD